MVKCFYLLYRKWKACSFPRHSGNKLTSAEPHHLVRYVSCQSFTLRESILQASAGFVKSFIHERWLPAKSLEGYQNAAQQKQCIFLKQRENVFSTLKGSCRIFKLESDNFAFKSHSEYSCWITSVCRRWDPKLFRRCLSEQVSLTKPGQWPIQVLEPGFFCTF